MRLEAWQDLPASPQKPRSAPPSVCQFDSSVHRTCSQTAFFLLKVRYRRHVDAFPDPPAGLEARLNDHENVTTVHPSGA